jgi:imidazolonepropionase
MLRLGTTTVEIKSGYGLSNDSEMMMLEGIREVADEELMSVVGTFLGAHAIPPEYAGREDAYVDLIISTMLPYIARRGLAEFCDVFCEPGYFTLEQTEKILGAARDSGLKRKVHADELQSSGGAEMAARMGATSADHLEHVSSAGIDALAASGTVGCVLPGVSMFLGHGYAPARRLIDAGAVVAIASDFNPGSCMSYSMPLMMTLACTQMRMTPEEALCASTLHGAAALGRSHEIGSIEVGKNADILLASVPDFRYLAYHVGVNHISTIIKNGTILEL